jgi:hypothetical protein
MSTTDNSPKAEVAIAERRLKKRHAFSATTEVIEFNSGARISTRAADLSQQGCFLDSLNPFAIGTKIRVRIHWDGTELICNAEVRDSQPGFGMGVAFTGLNDPGKALINRWIEKLDSPALSDMSLSALSEDAKPTLTSEQRDALAVRLIDLLQKKGLLSSNEVASLLRDLIM